MVLFGTDLKILFQSSYFPWSIASKELQCFIFSWIISLSLATSRILFSSFLFSALNSFRTKL